MSEIVKFSNVPIFKEKKPYFLAKEKVFLLNFIYIPFIDKVFLLKCFLNVHKHKFLMLI